MCTFTLKQNTNIKERYIFSEKLLIDRRMFKFKDKLIEKQIILRSMWGKYTITK